jgi:prolyl-tRNA editing enzyme YbaK/EbsC (Cys-tRNA(Pro) deacylase)
MKLDVLNISSETTLIPDVVRSEILNQGLESQIGLVQIDPNFADTTAFCEQYHWPIDHSANCVIVQARRGGRKTIAACIVLASTRADINKLVKKYLDASKISMAPMDSTLEESKMEYGGVTPIGLPKTWPILIDKAIMPLEQIVIGGGNRNTKLIVSGRLLASLHNAVIIDSLGIPNT